MSDDTLSLEDFWKVEARQERVVETVQRILDQYGIPRSLASGESVAQSAAGSVFRRIQEGEYAERSSEDELRQLIVAFARNKARNRTRSLRAGKRDFRRNVPQSDAGPLPDESDDFDFDRLDFTPLVDEVVQRVRQRARDVEQAERVLHVFREWLVGWTPTEIEQRLGLTRDQVSYALKLLKSVFEDVRRPYEDCAGDGTTPGVSP